MEKRKRRREEEKTIQNWLSHGLEVKGRGGSQHRKSGHVAPLEGIESERVKRGM